MNFKVAYLNHTEKMSGGEIYLLNLLKFLDRNQFRPMVILPCSGSLEAYLRELDIPVRIISANQRAIHLSKHQKIGSILGQTKNLLSLVFTIGKIVRYLKREKVSLVHTNSIKANFYGSLAAKLAGKPVIWHLHDILTADFFPSFFSHLTTIWANFFDNVIICNSNATKKAFIECGGRSKKAIKIHNGIDMSKFNPHNHPGISFRKELGLGENIPLVGHIGRLAPWKGQHILIEAAARILVDLPKTNFVLVGEALFGDIDLNYRKSLQTLIAKLGLENKVRLVGFRDDIPDVIAALNIVVHSSVAPEPFGFVVAEAMAMGKPIVAARAGGISEIVQDGVMGLLFEPGNSSALAEAILTILKDREKAIIMGQAGRKRIERFFTAERNVRQVENTYSKLLDKK